MAYPDPGPLLDEQLDELEPICAASERGGEFDPAAMAALCSGPVEDFEALDYVLGWHDRHDRKLLEAARLALSHGWRRGDEGHATDGR